MRKTRGGYFFKKQRGILKDIFSDCQSTKLNRFTKRRCLMNKKRKWWQLFSDLNDPKMMGLFYETNPHTDYPFQYKNMESSFTQYKQDKQKWANRDTKKYKFFSESTPAT